MRVERADFFFGVGAMALAAGYLASAGQIPESLLADAVGAAGLPRLLGWLMGTLGLLLCLRSLRLGAAKAPRTDRGAGHPHWRALGLLGIVTGTALIAPYVGYPLWIALLTGSVARYSGMPFGRNLVLVAIAAGIGFWLLFVAVLGIAMPVGMLLG